MEPLTPAERRRLRKKGVQCQLIRERIETLSDYTAVLGDVVSSADTFWFRGHSDYSWTLAPSALRYQTKPDRDSALTLVTDFKRIAEIKLPRPPLHDEELKWVQIARHYGLPTRLLDWTENALIALYFSCGTPATDGMVYVLNPVDLNRYGDLTMTRILNPHQDATVISQYLTLDGVEDKNGLPTVAINPVWNSERIMTQRGTFTLHGSRHFTLTQETAPSLVGVPILRAVKARLRTELERVGVDEMTIFPELDHVCEFLRKRSGL